VALFADGAITHTTIIPVGGNHVSYDLSVELRLSPEDAERVKVQSAAARPEDVDPREYVEFQMIGEEEPREAPRALLTQIVGPRMEELFRLLRAHVEKAAAEGVYVSTCVLSGGGSQLAGAAELAEQVMRMPVRIGRPREVMDARGLVDSPVYATAVGLLHFAAPRLRGERRPKEPQRSIAAAAFRMLAGWLRKVRR
jgi:cell division protein FtsA